MSEATRDSIRTTARVAFRTYEQLSDAEREAVLATLVKFEDPEAAEVAQDTLYYLRKQRAKQMVLKGMLA